MRLLLALISVCLTTSVFSQEINWPADTAQAQQNWALFTDGVRNQNFENAFKPFQWLVEQAPDLSPALYIQGEKLFRGLVSKTSEPTLRMEYQQRQLDLYDLRIRYFSEEEKVMNRKAHSAYQYYRNNPEKLPELLGIFEQAFQVSRQQFSSANLVAYMDVMRRSRKAGNAELTDEEVLRRYDQISQILQQKIASDTKEKQQLLDDILIATVTLDCATIQEKFGAPFLNDTTQVDQAKKLLSLALAFKCSSAPFFLSALQTVYRNEPSAGTAKTLAKLYDAQQQAQHAEYYWQQAIDLTDNGKEQAELWYALAQHYQRNNRKPQARKAAQKGLQQYADLSEAYKLMGDLYFSSFEECKQSQQMTQDRAVYWAAYEMYKRAGRIDLMQQVAQQFPTVEQIFQEGLTEGETTRVGCWIDEEVTIRRRPSSS